MRRRRQGGGRNKAAFFLKACTGARPPQRPDRSDASFIEVHRLKAPTHTRAKGNQAPCPYLVCQKHKTHHHARVLVACRVSRARWRPAVRTCWLIGPFVDLDSQYRIHSRAVAFSTRTESTGPIRRLLTQHLSPPTSFPAETTQPRARRRAAPVAASGAGEGALWWRQQGGAIFSRPAIPGPWGPDFFCVASPRARGKEQSGGEGQSSVRPPPRCGRWNGPSSPCTTRGARHIRQRACGASSHDTDPNKLPPASSASRRTKTKKKLLVTQQGGGGGLPNPFDMGKLMESVKKAQQMVQVETARVQKELDELSCCFANLRPAGAATKTPRGRPLFSRSRRPFRQTENKTTH